MIADDHAYINARLEEIKAGRLNPSEADPVATKNYLGGDEPAKEPAIYLGWDIYAPVNISGT